MTNVALVGVSGFAATHYFDLLRQLEKGKIRLVAATVINQQAEAEKCEHLRQLGCELFLDYREMLASHAGNIELCLIPTGLPLHAPITIEALQAGANVLVEKPAAGTVQNVAAMSQAERKTGKFCAVGYQSIYAPETLWMKEKILEGSLGQIESIKCRVQWPRSDAYYARNGWAGRLRVGNQWILDSPINNAASHFLNQICFLAGSELRTSARVSRIEAELYRAREMESPDTAALRITTHLGLPLLFLCTHAAELAIQPEIVVRGTRGTLTWTMDFISIALADGSLEKRECLQGQELRDCMVDTVLRRVSDPNVFVCDLAIAGTQTLCVNGAHEATPVRALPNRYLSEIWRDDQRFVAIDGMERLMKECFVKERLFCEVNAKWSGPAGKLELADYRKFSGPCDIQ